MGSWWRLDALKLSVVLSLLAVQDRLCRLAEKTASQRSEEVDDGRHAKAGLETRKDGTGHTNNEEVDEDENGTVQLALGAVSGDTALGDGVDDGGGLGACVS